MYIVMAAWLPDWIPCRNVGGGSTYLIWIMQYINNYKIVMKINCLNRNNNISVYLPTSLLTLYLNPSNLRTLKNYSTETTLLSMHGQMLSLTNKYLAFQAFVSLISLLLSIPLITLQLSLECSPVVHLILVVSHTCCCQFASSLFRISSNLWCSPRFCPRSHSFKSVHYSLFSSALPPVHYMPTTHNLLYPSSSKTFR